MEENRKKSTFPNLFRDMSGKLDGLNQGPSFPQFTFPFSLGMRDGIIYIERNGACKKLFGVFGTLISESQSVLSENLTLGFQGSSTKSIRS